MGPGRRRKPRLDPGDGRPLKGGRTEPGGKLPSKPKPSRHPKESTLQARRSFTGDERRQTVEAYQKSSLTQEDFARAFGISKGTLKNWLERYREAGPKALERRPHGGRGKSRLKEALKEEIVQAKVRFPDFGFKRVRDYLARFRGLKVSAGAIQKTLATHKLESPTPVQAKARKAKKKIVRRFERAKPGQLWQSDITSFVLTRHGTRAYLTVFLDDFSRYIVSFALALHQKTELVTEALLSGIDRFGKPREILTDQGRQYHSWRGKGVFQKLLEKQGIQHVVARSHHPQTVGKTERFWKTVQEEFWSRVNPQELDEARERLSHFIAHYNHHRPHQGIGGLVPADRFFGAESEVRRALESQMAKNELRLALGEPPRRSVYLVGRIGDKAVSMHGERGKLVINAEEGQEEMDPKQLGMAQEVSDERSDDRGGNRGDATEGEATQETGELPDADASGLAGQGVMGGGGGGGEEACPRNGGGDLGDVAGADDAPGGGHPPRSAAASGVAAVAAGADGSGGGAPAAAEDQGEGVRPLAGGNPLETEEHHCQAEAGGGELEKPGEALAGPAGPQGVAPGRGGEACPREERDAEHCPGRPSGPSQDGFWNKAHPDAIEKPWRERTE